MSAARLGSRRRYARPPLRCATSPRVSPQACRKATRSSPTTLAGSTRRHPQEAGIDRPGPNSCLSSVQRRRKAMKFVTYLNFDGRCREAFEFYAKTLGGEIIAMHDHRGAPASEHVPANWQDKIMNAHLKVGDQELMGSDSPPQ